MSDDYNYAVFRGSEDFVSFRSALPVGSVAPDFAAADLATGGAVKLSACWAAHDLLIEFGSFT
jgi:hypothetical protein